MSKSKLHYLLIAIGAVTMAAGSQMKLGATLTEQGTILGTTSPSEPMWIQAQAVLPAAPASNSMGIMALGMLIMLIGFGLHAFWILRKREADRTVPVKQAKKSPRTSRKQMEVIWVERTIRL